MINSKIDVKQELSRISMVVFDFDGVFTDNRVLVLADGREAVFCSRGDGFGLGILREAGLKLLVISSEVNPIVKVRCDKLKVPFLQGCASKLEVLKVEAEKHKVLLEDIAYLGNDINDIECLENVGFPACVCDAHPKVINIVKYVTEQKGGYGAVREFCDLIMEARNG